MKTTAQRYLLAGGLFFIGATTQASAALSLENYSANQHYRYANDPDFIGAGFDWSGTGSEVGSKHWATMISPTYFISAKHYFPGVGSSILFHTDNNPTGATVTTTVTSITQIGSTDLVIGRFSTAPGPTVAIYGIAAPSTTVGGFASSPYANREAFVVGRDAGNGTESFRLGRNILDGFEINSEGGSTGDIITFNDDSPGDAHFLGDDEAFLQSGDSGAPLFITSGSDLALTGIHWTILPDSGPTYSGSTFVPNYITEIQTIVGAGGENITLINIPEPSSVILLLLGGISFLWRRRI